MKYLLILLVVLVGCGNNTIGSSTGELCVPKEKFDIYVDNEGVCSGDGSKARPFCRLSSAAELIMSDTCSEELWTIHLKGTRQAYDPFVLNSFNSGDNIQLNRKNVKIIGWDSLFTPSINGGDFFDKVRSGIYIGSKVTLTLEDIWIVNTQTYGIVCNSLTSQACTSDCDSTINVIGKNVDIPTRIQDVFGAIYSVDCRVKLRNVYINYAYDGALTFYNKTIYDIDELTVRHSFSDNGLLYFDSSTIGNARNIIVVDNITKYAPFYCGSTERTFTKVKLTHKAPAVNNADGCKFIDSTIVQINLND